MTYFRVDFILFTVSKPNLMQSIGSSHVTIGIKNYEDLSDSDKQFQLNESIQQLADEAIDDESVSYAVTNIFKF